MLKYLIFIIITIIFGCKKTDDLKSPISSDQKIYDLSYSFKNNTLILRNQIEILAPFYPTYYGTKANNFSIEPNLPKGLSFSTLSGRIAGTPEELLTIPTEYTVKATNDYGTSLFKIRLQILSQVPFGLHYSVNNYELITNESELSIFPIINQGVRGGAKIDYYSISPELPNGLIFDTHTGSIEGTPTTKFNPIIFTITGYNSGGNVGTNIIISAKSNYSDISLGNDHSCAVIDLKFYCWGDNSSGQLGTSVMGTSSLIPTQLNFLFPFEFRNIKLGNKNTCVTLIDGSLYCWGKNSNNQFGPELLNLTYNIPQLVTDSIIDVGLSKDQNYGFTCATINNDIGVCYGQLNGIDFSTVGNQLKKQDNSLINGIFDIKTSNNNVCLINNNSLYCLGDNSYGQLANSQINGQTLKMSIPNNMDINVSQVAVGNGFICSIKANKVYCWGRNDKGQLGVPSLNYANTDIPTLVEGLPQDYIATNIYAGDSHVCAMIDLKLYCWGDNSYGQIGNGNKNVVLNPYKILNNQNEFNSISKVSLGKDHSCMIADLNLYCWGRNDKGQLGVGNSIDQPSPTPIAY